MAIATSRSDAVRSYFAGESGDEEDYQLPLDQKWRHLAAELALRVKPRR